MNQNVFVAGRNDAGKDEDTLPQHITVPTKISFEAPSPIVAMYCTDNNIIMHCLDGVLYARGSNGMFVCLVLLINKT